MTGKITHLYTLILDYQGGTYVSQMTGDSPEHAFFKWLEQLDLDMLGVKYDTHDSILKDIEYLEDRPVQLSGLRNVWCLSLLFDNILALVNIVKTCIDTEPYEQNCQASSLCLTAFPDQT